MSGRPLITFWGTRGSIATPGRSTEKYGGNTSCVSVLWGGRQFIFDAGTGIRGLGVEIMAGSPAAGKTELNLFLSHTHWDHIQGMPFFQPAYSPRFRLNIWGQEKRDVMLESVLSGQMDSNYFPVPMSALGSDLAVHPIGDAAIRGHGSVEVDGVKVSFQEMDHPGGSLAFRLEKDGICLVYATDNELNRQFDDKGDPLPGSEVGRDYLEFIRGADLLIADGQYTDEEYRSKVGWGHTTVSLLSRIAHKAGVRHLAVYHHDPMHTDSFLDSLSSEFIRLYKESAPPMEVLWAREGLTLQL